MGDGPGGKEADHDEPIVVDNKPVSVNFSRPPGGTNHVDWDRSYTVFDRLSFELTTPAGQKETLLAYLQALSTITFDLRDKDSKDHKLTFKTAGNKEIKVKTPKFKEGSAASEIVPDGIEDLRITKVSWTNSIGKNESKSMMNGAAFKYETVHITIHAEDEAAHP
jgi:hypothetical protein